MTYRLTTLACALGLFVIPSDPSCTTSSFMRHLNCPASQEDDTPQPAERRAAIRYKLGRDGTCYLASANSPRGVPAWWTDISTLGIGLIAEQPFEPRTLLVVELKHKAGSSMLLGLARVRHVAPWGPKRWWLGCKLCRKLTQDELETLLAGGGSVE